MASHQMLRSQGKPPDGNAEGRDNIPQPFTGKISLANAQDVVSIRAFTGLLADFSKRRWGAHENH